jgi:hypothetical protein
MRSLKGWALAPTSTGATKTGARRRRGRLAAAAITALLAATLVPGVATPASADVSVNGVGALAANGFPAWFSDGTTKLALCDNGLANGCLGSLAVDGEAFYFAAQASTPAQPALFEVGLEGTTAGGNLSFTRIRFRMTGLTDGATYTIRHPYGVSTFIAGVGAGKTGGAVRGINNTVDFGCDPCTTLADFSVAGTNFAGNYAAGVRPTFLRQSNPAPGFIGNIDVPGTVTGAPSGLNAVIVTGPNAGGVGVNTLRVDQFIVQGRIDPAAITPIVVPNAPIMLSGATAGNGSVQASWTAPGNGGSALRIYHVRVVGGDGVKLFKLQDIAAPAGFAPVSLNLTGLPNGIALRVQVQAINAVGISGLSNHSGAVIPATTPNAPKIGPTTAGIGSATGSWTAPYNGGAAIQRYHVRVVDAATGRKVFVLRDISGSLRSMTAALPRGLAVRFQVQAINVVGISPNSAVSNGVIVR